MSEGGIYEASKPTWEPLSLHCGECGETWGDWQPSGCVLEVWVSVMSAMRCPHCGAERHLFVQPRKPERTEIPLDD